MRLQNYQIKILGWTVFAVFMGVFVFGVNSLRADDSNSAPAGVYAASESIPARRMNVATLLSQFTAHNYQEVFTRPTQAGQFQVTDEGIAIITRDFIDEQGSYSPKMNLLFRVSSGRIENRLGPAPDALHLEPLPLTTSDAMFIGALKEAVAKDQHKADKIFTFIVPTVQQCATQAVMSGSAAQALVAMDIGSRTVFAWAERNPAHGAESLVTTHRPLGGMAKPFVYLTTLDDGLSKGTTLTPLSEVNPPSPTQEAASSLSPLAADEAATRTRLQEPSEGTSSESPTLRETVETLGAEDSLMLESRLGKENVRQTLDRFSLKDETSLLSLTAAFAAIGGGGSIVPPRLYSAIIDDSGKAVAVSAPAPETVSTPVASYILSDMLRGTVNHGALRILRDRGFRRDVAATIASSDTQSAWFVAYTPFMVTGVWSQTSEAGAIDTWLAFMKCFDPMLPEVTFAPPPGVQMASVDRSSFQLAGRRCPKGSIEPQAFAANNMPTESCTKHDRSGRQDNADQSQANRSRSQPSSNRNSLRNFWRDIERQAERVLRR